MELIEEVKVEIQKQLDADIPIYIISAISKAGCQELVYAIHQWITGMDKEEDSE